MLFIFLYLPFIVLLLLLLLLFSTAIPAELNTTSVVLCAPHVALLKARAAVTSSVLVKAGRLLDFSRAAGAMVQSAAVIVATYGEVLEESMGGGRWCRQVTDRFHIF